MFREVIRRASGLLLGLALLTSCAGAKQAAPTPVPTAPRATASAGSVDETVYQHTGPGDLSAAVRDFPSRVYVPNSKSNTVDVIDPRTYRVVGHFGVGKLPQHVTPSWDMRHLYVDNDLANSLTSIDPMTGKPGRVIPVTDPYNLYFTPDGRNAIVVAERLRRLGFRDPRTWELVGSMSIPHAGPNHLDFSRDGRYLLISCEFSGYVVKIDLASRQVVGELHIGGKPVDIRVDPKGDVFYVANETRNGISVVDPVQMKELAFIRTGAGTHGFVVSRDARRLYVTNRLGGTISVLDFAARRIVDTWIIGGSPDMGGVSIDGKVLWVSGRYNARVYAIDTSDGNVLARIRVGSGPHGVCVFPQPGRFSLGHTGNYR